MFNKEEFWGMMLDEARRSGDKEGRGKINPSARLIN
jgi:hypothetical protein